MIRRVRCRTLLLAAVLLAGGCGVLQRDPGPGLVGVGVLPPPASAWPAAGYDARHSSATPATGPQHGTVKWKAKLGGDLTPGPVIGVDGSILAASHLGVLSALDPATGEPRWQLDGHGSYGSDLSTSPAVLADGTILWPGPGSALFGVSSSGTLLWKETFDSQVLSPAVAGAGRVYVADRGGDLAALTISAAGPRRMWTLNIGDDDYASPTVGPDGTVYTAAGNDLVAVRDLGNRGAVRWRFHAKSLVEVSNAVAPDGTVVLGTNDDRQYGIRADGSVAWTYDKGEYTYSSSVVRPDGKAYFGDNQGRLTVLNSGTGRQLQRTQGDRGVRTASIWTAPAVDARGDAYVATQTGWIYGFAPDGTQLFALNAGAAVNSYPAIGADGTLYLGTTDGHLLAIAGP